MEPPARLKRLAKVRQACDACRTRKIRCDGCKPCAGCVQSASACTYLAVQKKTGPKGPRRPRPVAKPQPVRVPALFTSMFDPNNGSPTTFSPDSTGSQAASGSTESTFTLQWVDDQAAAPAASSDQIVQLEQPQDIGYGPSLFEDQIFYPSSEVSDDLIRWCLDAFFEHKYSVTPIIHRQEVEDFCNGYPKSPEKYSLFTACCAVISLSPGILKPRDLADAITLPSTEHLIAESLRARQACPDIAESPSLTHVQASFFLFSTFFCQEKNNAAWFYLREAMTLLQTLRYHEEDTYLTLLENGDFTLATYARRMFWVLFITERAFALQRHRPLTLRCTLDLPTVADPLSSPSNHDDEILPGFLDLISLFRHFDTDFIETWNSAASTPSSTGEVPTSISQPLSHLQDILKRSLPSILHYSKAQQADLLISRQWLKTMVWQLCVSKVALTSGQSSEDSMSLTYPVTIARDAVLVSSLLPQQALEANGVGILEKIFDIGCSLADLLVLRLGSGNTVYSTTTSGMEVGPVDTLMEIVRILGTTLGGSYRHTSILVNKAKDCLYVDVDRGPALPGVQYVEELDYDDEVVELL